jgi:hypothetical protein
MHDNVYFNEAVIPKPTAKQERSKVETYHRPGDDDLGLFRGA